MRSRPRSVPVVLLVPLLLVLSGCGSDSDSGDADGPGGSASAEAAASFTAEESGEAVRVCSGDAMTNARAYDPDDPAVAMFELAQLAGSAPWTNRMTPSEPADFLVSLTDDGPDAISVVACAVGVEAHRDDAIECEADASDGGTTTYHLAPIDWRVELREAATGEVLATDSGLLTSPLDRCPYTYEPDEYEPGPGDPDATQDVVERLLGQG